MPLVAVKSTSGNQKGTWVKRIKRLPQELNVLLSCLLLALKPGGRMVYLTCVVTLEGKKYVVDRFIKEKGTQAKFVDFDWFPLPRMSSMSGNCTLDPTWVRRIFPDNYDGLEPMFIVVF